MHTFTRNTCVWLAALPPTLWAASDLPCRANLSIATQAAEAGIQVQVKFSISVPRDVVWNVITDYANAARFIQSLQQSSMTTLDSNRVRVQQTGRVGWGPFTALVYTQYDVRLHPDQYWLEGHLVGGDMRHMHMTSRLQTTLPETGTTLHYAATIDPGTWIPRKLAEPVLKQSALESFQDLALEIARRSPTCPKGP